MNGNGCKDGGGHQHQRERVQRWRRTSTSTGTGANMEEDINIKINLWGGKGGVGSKVEPVSTQTPISVGKRTDSARGGEPLLGARGVQLV